MTCKKAEARQGKVYVGKLPPGEAMSKEDLQEHFSQYGEVVEVVRPVDKMKNNEPKTFAFITFAREDAAKQLVKQGSTVVGEFTLEIKKVTPKDPSGGYQGWGGAGWGGAAWGGGYGGYGAYGGGGYGMDYGYGGYEGTESVCVGSNNLQVTCFRVRILWWRLGWSWRCRWKDERRYPGWWRRPRPWRSWWSSLLT